MDFKERIADEYQTTDGVGVFQANSTGKSNIRCEHSHIMKNRDYKEMSKETKSQ